VIPVCIALFNRGMAHPSLLKSDVDYCAELMIFETAVKEFSGATQFSVQFLQVSVCALLMPIEHRS
jgi:hypothetical protein